MGDLAPELADQPVGERTGLGRRHLFVALDQPDCREVEIVDAQMCEACGGELGGEGAGVAGALGVERERAQEEVELLPRHSRLEDDARRAPAPQELGELCRGGREKLALLPEQGVARSRELEWPGLGEHGADGGAGLGQSVHRCGMAGGVGGQGPPGDRQIAEEIGEESVQPVPCHRPRLYAPLPAFALPRERLAERRRALARPTAATSTIPG